MAQCLCNINRMDRELTHMMLDKFGGIFYQLSLLLPVHPSVMRPIVGEA